MRYLHLGYLILILSPVLSAFIYVMIRATIMIFIPTLDFFWMIKALTCANILMIGVQVCGLILYFVDYGKGEFIPFSPIALVPNVLLLLWGSYVAYVEISDLIFFVTIGFIPFYGLWPYMEFTTWALKALLWIFSAVILTITLKRGKGNRNI